MSWSRTFGGGSVDKEAIQTRDYCVAKNATQRAARPDPSRRKERLLRMTINLARYTTFFLADIHVKVTCNRGNECRRELTPSRRETRSEHIASGCVNRAFDRSKFGFRICVRPPSPRKRTGKPSNSKTFVLSSSAITSRLGLRLVALPLCGGRRHRQR